MQFDYGWKPYKQRRFVLSCAFVYVSLRRRKTGSKKDFESAASASSAIPALRALELASQN
jgi:hypothetical protein